MGKKFLFQIQLNVKRIVVRNLRFLLLSILMPIGFYLLFTRLMTSGMSAAVLTNWNAQYLISMIVYSALLSSVFTVANTLVEDAQNHFKLFITLSPVSKLHYYLSMSGVFLALTIFSTVALECVAIVVNHVQLSILDLLFVLLLVPILSIPLLLLGIMVSLASTSNVVGALSNLIVFPMAIVSGLWWPMAMMPSVMKTIGQVLPAYQLTKILTAVVFKHTFPIKAVIILIIWTVIFSIFLKILIKHQSKSEAQVI